MSVVTVSVCLLLVYFMYSSQRQEVVRSLTRSSEIVELSSAMELIISLRLCCHELLPRKVLPSSIKTCRSSASYYFLGCVGCPVPVRLSCHCRRGAPLSPRPLCDARAHSLCRLLESACLGYCVSGRFTEAEPRAAEEEEAAPWLEACPSRRCRLLG